MSSTRELLEMRLKKFLHYGFEQPVYSCGDRFHYECYDEDHVTSLRKLISKENPESIVEIILQVNRDNTSVWPDALTFALAYCAHQEQSVKLQQEAYQAVRKVCKTARDIILFVKFYRDLKKKKGGGNGFKRAVAQWYLVWMPFDLAEMFLKQNSYFGWSHADVLRVCHVKPISIEQQVLFSYVIKGLSETNKKFAEGANQEVAELLDYLNSVEAFKKIEDPEQSAKALSLELHSIERVPPKMLKHHEVWNELIPHMDVETLLNNLQRISILGFLKNNNVTVMKVIDVLNNVHKAESFKGHPTRVYIELLTYEKAATYCLHVANKFSHPISKITPARRPPKCNILIKNALSKFFYSLYKFQKPTGLRYLVAVDVRPKMFTERCQHSLYLNPIEAAQAVCLSLVRTEALDKVTVGAFVEPKGSIVQLHCEKEWDIPKFANSFKDLTLEAGPASVVSAIHWADTNDWPIDVFIILSNYNVCTSGTRVAISKYRTSKSLPDAKVITCSFSGKIKTHKDVEGLNMMNVVGFDEKICRLIEVFSRGAF